MRYLKALPFLLLGLFAQGQGLPLVETFHYHSQVFDSAAVDHHAYDEVEKRLYITDNYLNRLYIYDVSDLDKIGLLKNISLSNYGTTVSDVAAHGDAVAVSFVNGYPQGNGKLIFFDKEGDFQNQLLLGKAPKSMRYANNGQYLIITNEGFPSSNYADDPPGTISVVQLLGAQPSVINQSYIADIGFELLDSTAYDSKIRVYGNQGQQSPSEDLEPEGIALDENSDRAFISLPENNAFAVINYFDQSLDTVIGLPYKSFETGNAGLDASDQRSSIHISSYDSLFGIYQPTGIASFSDNGTVYITTANRGAARQYSAFNEVERVRFLPLRPSSFPNRGQLQRDTVLGRLQVTTTLGNGQDGLIYDSLFTFGGRSFSIWDENGQLVWDSGDEIEQTLAQMHAANFNSAANDNQSFKAQSDNKGPEPHTLAVGEVDGVRYAFVSLWQMGGIMIYNIDNPSNPVFDSYLINRDFSKSASDPDAGDLGPEEITFVPAGESPNGIALLIVSNSVSGSLTLYQAGAGIGLPEVQLEPNVVVYPNPGTGIFHTNARESLQVYNSLGQLVKEVDRQEDIDLRGQPDGYYLVKTRNGKALKILKK